VYVCGTIPLVFWYNFPNCALQGTPQGAPQAPQGKRSHCGQWRTLNTLCTIRGCHTMTPGHSGLGIPHYPNPTPEQTPAQGMSVHCMRAHCGAWDTRTHVLLGRGTGGSLLRFLGDLRCSAWMPGTPHQIQGRGGASLPGDKFRRG